jgi:ligand-binding SRPBCC domain-containing protein
MGVYYLHAEQLLPVDIQTAWAFFSSPNNLVLITPPEMDFIPLTPMADGAEIYPGMLIDYKVKPLLGIPLRWQTGIMSVEKPHRFTDSQLKGPYRIWEHTHIFTQTDNGVLMKDEVKYQLPFGPLGSFAHALLVRKKLQALFRYRKAAIERLLK